MAAARRRQSGEFEREPSLEEKLDREEAARKARESGPDLLDFPAAVICTRCGESDCGGNCENDLSRSGIVSVVAWERPTGTALSRMWLTARATTRDAEAFFELLPDGPLMPALRFAAICELLASSAAFVGFLAIAAIVEPGWVKQILTDSASRAVALRVLVFALPAFASLLVAAHVTHGLSIDYGATKNGARSARSRALRFGLYACGWDLVIGPIGAVVIALQEGWSSAMKLSSALTGVPSRSTTAFLRGCYHLDGEPAKKALATSYAGAFAATLAFAVIVLAALVALAVS